MNEKKGWERNLSYTSSSDFPFKKQIITNKQKEKLKEALIIVHTFIVASITFFRAHFLGRMYIIISLEYRWKGEE